MSHFTVPKVSVFVFVLGSMLAYQNCSGVKFGQSAGLKSGDLASSSASTGDGAAGNSGSNGGTSSPGGSSTDNDGEKRSKTCDTDIQCVRAPCSCSGVSDDDRVRHDFERTCGNEWSDLDGDTWGDYVPQELPLKEAQVSASCSNGIEINNLSGTYEMSMSSPSANARQGWIDYATYAAPNTIRILSEDGQGHQKEIFAASIISTWCRGFTSLERPPDDSIRQRSIAIPAGSVKLIFDFQGGSPFYVRVQGLCDLKRSVLHRIDSQKFSRGGDKKFRAQTYPEFQDLTVN